MRRVLCLALLAALVGIASDGLRAQPQSGTKHYLILAKGQGPGSTAFLNSVAAAGGTVTAIVDDIGVVLVDSSEPSFLRNIRRHGLVQDAAEDVEFQWIPPNEQGLPADVIPADALPEANQESRSALQWNLRQIHADETAANGDRGWGVVRARVAVLDSGIIPDHPDIQHNLNLELSKSFVPTEPSLLPPADGFNHGTHVAGIIAAPINGIGVQGVAPEAELVAVKVLSAEGSGQFSWLVQGIMYASGPDVRADVINMSLGATFDRINAGGGGARPAPCRAEPRGQPRDSLRNAGGQLRRERGGEPEFTHLRCSSAVRQRHGSRRDRPGRLGHGRVVRRHLRPPGVDSNYGQSVVGVAAPGGDFAYPGDENCTVVTGGGPITRPCWVFDMVDSPAGYTLTG